MSKMRVRFWDVETSPLLLSAWGLYDQHFKHDSVQREWNLLTVAWKDLGRRPAVVTVSPKSPTDDRAVCAATREALLDADVLVSHNGHRFDHRKLNARLVKHGLRPLPPLKTVDTLKVARSVFAFTSNRLDYLGNHLSVGRKIPTTYSLWLDVLAGDAAALARMAKYNAQDVCLLEDVYRKLLPFIPNHPNANLWSGGTVCPNCSSRDLTKWGYYRARSVVRRRYSCKACGAWCAGERVATVKVTA